LKEEDTLNTILIVASRTVSRYISKEVPFFLNYDYQDKSQQSKKLNRTKINYRKPEKDINKNQGFKMLSELESLKLEKKLFFYAC